MKGKERMRGGWRGMVWGKWGGLVGMDAIMTIRNKKVEIYRIFRYW